MKKLIKYILWLPFAVSISSFVLYFVYAIRIKFKNLMVTENMQNSLKIYLIIGLISLFVGLFVIFIKKIVLLFKIDDIDNIKENSLKEEKVISVPLKKYKNNFSKNELILKISNPVFKNNKITGILNDTNQNVIICFDEKENKNKFITKSEKNEDNLIEKECHECGYPISKKATICPHCGILFDEKLLELIRNNEKKLKKKNKKISFKKIILDMLLILLFMILIFLVINLLINKRNENYNNVSGTNIVIKE